MSTKKQKTSKVAAAASPSKPKPAAAPKREKKWTWKKPKDKPRRPLSAYNLFFRLERELLIQSKGKQGTAAETKDDLTMAVAKILAETKAEREAEEKAGGPIEHKRPHRRGGGNLGFKNLAQTIAHRWKHLDRSDRTIYEAAAALEMKQYKQDIERWQLKQKLKNVANPNKYKKTAEGTEKGMTSASATVVVQKKIAPVQDVSAPAAAAIASSASTTSNSFAPVFNPSVQMDFTPLFTPLPHTPVVAGTSGTAGGTSRYRPVQQDQAAAATAAASASTAAGNTFDSRPVRKSSSASNLSFLVEAGLLPASIMEEDCGGLFPKDIPPETQQELLAKATDMPQVFDDDLINFLASPDYDFPPDQLEQEDASAPAPAPAAGRATYEEKPPSYEEIKTNSAEQTMVPAPDGQKVPFMARSA